MTRSRLLAIGLLTVALVAGTRADRPVDPPVITLGGYRVLQADFHVHTSAINGGGVSPIGLILEARRRGLDVIATIGHNQMLDARIGVWADRFLDGPIVVPGQEVLHPHHHLLALGVHDAIDPHAPLAEQIAHVHRQGGVAIAAHPRKPFASEDPAGIIQTLDGADICHPSIFNDRDAQADYERFAASGSFAAIGSSDFHVFGRVGLCRTFVFVREATVAGVLDAVRGHRTVVYGLNGKAYGDPQLMALAEADGRLRALAAPDAPVTVLDWTSRVCGVAGLLVLAVIARNSL